MAINPVEQNLCFEEQVSMLGDDLTRKATYQEIQEMKYLEIFIKESQRLYPAVSLIGRRANEGLVLCMQRIVFVFYNCNMIRKLIRPTADGKKVPKDTSVAILLFVMGYNPAVFPNPEVFDPTRFLPENRALKNPYEYVPFSAGSRNCIGQKFANNELRLVLSEVVRHFHILPTKEPFQPMIAATATTHSDNGIWIRVKRRDVQA